MDLKEVVVGTYIYFLNTVSPREYCLYVFSISEEIGIVIFFF